MTRDAVAVSGASAPRAANAAATARLEVGASSHRTRSGVSVDTRASRRTRQGVTSTSAAPASSPAGTDATHRAAAVSPSRVNRIDSNGAGDSARMLRTIRIRFVAIRLGPDSIRPDPSREPPPANTWFRDARVGSDWRRARRGRFLQTHARKRRAGRHARHASSVRSNPRVDAQRVHDRSPRGNRGVGASRPRRRGDDVVRERVRQHGAKRRRAGDAKRRPVRTKIRRKRFARRR